MHFFRMWLCYVSIQYTIRYGYSHYIKTLFILSGIRYCGTKRINESIFFREFFGVLAPYDRSIRKMIKNIFLLEYAEILFLLLCIFLEITLVHVIYAFAWSSGHHHCSKYLYFSAVSAYKKNVNKKKQMIF